MMFLKLRTPPLGPRQSEQQLIGYRQAMCGNLKLTLLYSLKQASPSPPKKETWKLAYIAK